jgi:hypothetical protein
MIGLKRLSVCVGAIFCVSPAFADTWVEGAISEIRVLSTGTPANDGIIVLGTFSPSLGCTNNGFMLFSGDVNFKESYAALLAAKASGLRVKFLHSFCMTNGYARGNGYAIAE